MDFARFKKDALHAARSWARSGNGYLTAYYLSRAESVGYVSRQQVAALKKMLKQGERKARNANTEKPVVAGDS